MGRRSQTLLIVGVLLVGGCAAPRPGAGLAPQYAAAPAAPTADPARTEVAVVPTGDARLDAALVAIAGAFERHDWRALAYTLDADAYAVQFGFFRSDARAPADAVGQILEETFGLNTAGNTVYPTGLRRAERPFAGLDRIRMVRIDAAEPDGGFVRVEGRVALDDRTSRTLSFLLSEADDGYRVVVPMG